MYCSLPHEKRIRASKKEWRGRFGFGFWPFLNGQYQVLYILPSKVTFQPNIPVSSYSTTVRLHFVLNFGTTSWL